MNTLCLVACAFLCGLTYGRVLTSEKQVKLTLYYESLCPYSREFIVDQLYPTFSLLGTKRLYLELIPWGHATEKTVNGTKIFSCQHGPNECYGNKVQACVLDATAVDQSTLFVYCSENSDNPADDSNLQLCAEKAGISWTDIKTCASSAKGDDLLSALGKKTAVVNPAYVPMIYIDGAFSDENEAKARSDLKSLICELTGNPKEC